MIKTLLLKFWPALIPIIVYILVKWWLKRKREQEGNPTIIDADKKWYEGELFWVILLSLLTVIACFIIFFVLGEYGQPGDYTPPSYQDGEIIPGKIHP